MWIEMNTGNWWDTNWQLVDLSIYKDIRWLSQTEGFAIYGIPKAERVDNEDKWDCLFSHSELRPVMREYRRIKRTLIKRRLL